MPDVVWGGLHRDTNVVTCTSMGLQPGPVGGDGWVKLSGLPTSKLLPGRHYAFIVSGTMRGLTNTGGSPIPNRGLAQICLGDESGVRSPQHCFEIGVNVPLSPGAGVPFQFLVIFSSDYSITEPAWGATWPNTDELSLYGRTFWNGDPATYAASFIVEDVSYLWFDLENIGASRHFADRHAPASPLVLTQTGTLQTLHLGGSMPGNAGEKWLHFVNLAFTPDSIITARFQHERTPSFLPGTPEIGSRIWGCQRRGAAYNASFRNPTMHFGSFCTVDRPSGTQKWGYRGDGDVVVYRWSHLAVRIDQLPEVSTLSMTDVGPSSTVVQVFHEPPPRTGTIAQPIYLACGRAWDVSTIAGRRSRRWRLKTRSGRVLVEGVPIDNLTGEGVPLFGADTFGLGPGDGPRYENELIQSSTPGVGDAHRIDDLEFCQLWLIEDPTIQPPEPPEPGDFVVVIPSREGVSIGSQQAVPIDPEWRSESAAQPRAEILGSTGVRRTWPLFTAPRREWTLVWPALTNAQGVALEAFLRANRTFKARPPQESSDVALLAVEPVRLEMATATGPAWSCSIRVAELVFVGGA